jgi:hypothetical protein
MRFDTLKIAGRAHLRTTNGQRETKPAGMMIIVGEHEWFKYMDRVNTEVNATVTRKRKVLNDVRHKYCHGKGALTLGTTGYVEVWLEMKDVLGVVSRCGGGVCSSKEGDCGRVRKESVVYIGQ